MPVFSKSLDVYQGYNFKKDKQTAVGFITALDIGGTKLDADQAINEPTKGDTLKVVAVLNAITWETGVTDSVYFSGQISAPNKQNVATLIYNSLSSVEVKYKFVIFEYDPVAKKYFQCFHCNDTEMMGLLEKNGEDLNIAVADDASYEVQSPENYSFQIGIKPQPSAQTLHIATADGKNVVKAWGLEVAA